MIEFTEELKESAKEFRRTFGYSLPTSMIPPVIDNKELIEAIRNCIANKEDNLLEILGVEYENDILF